MTEAKSGLGEDREGATARTEADASRLWSLVRNILTQGHSQQQDYAAGKYANYEELSARVDVAARERAAEILGLLSEAARARRSEWHQRMEIV